MADHSKIEWTEATWNPITGCSIDTPGCIHCYAMKLAGTRLRNHPSRIGLTKETANGPVWTGEVRFNEGWLRQPIQWKRPRMIFVCAHGDLFHENVPDEWIDRVFAVMAVANHHTFQVLTKRAARMRAYLSDPEVGMRITRHWLPMTGFGKSFELPLPNVWLGVSAERQKEAVKRIPDLLQTPAAIRFLSAEPLIGEIDLMALIDWPGCATITDALQGCIGHNGGPDGEGRVMWEGAETCAKLDWVIVGGESGNNARPMHPKWARSLRDQCINNGVALFFKQWGMHQPFEMQPGQVVTEFKVNDRFVPFVQMDQFVMAKVGKETAGRLLDGQLYSEFPQVAA